MIRKKSLGFRFTKEGEHTVKLQKGATILSAVADHQCSITICVMVDEVAIGKSDTYIFNVIAWSNQPFDNEDFTFLDTVVVKEVTFFQQQVYHVFYKKK